MGKLIPLIFLAVLVLFFCSASLGTAGDGNRSGFIIGGGIGIGVTYYEYIDYYDSTEIKSVGPTSHYDWRIGCGFKGDKLLVYLLGNGNIFSYDDPTGWDFYMNIVHGLGLSYYFQPSSPSFYINAGIGAPFEAYGYGDNSIIGGIGYEYRKHWSVEFNLAYSKYYEDEMALSVALSIVGIAY